MQQLGTKQPRHQIDATKARDGFVEKMEWAAALVDKLSRGGKINDDRNHAVRCQQC